MHSEPRVVDLPDRTLIISHDPNLQTYTCSRCGKTITEPVQAEPDTVVVWPLESHPAWLAPLRQGAPYHGVTVEGR